MVCSRYPKEYRYYEIVLKKKCFRKLRRNVWETKTKWILIKVAEGHYRQKLLRKCINRWVVYLNERYKKKLNRRAAIALHEDKLKKKGIRGLKITVDRSEMVGRICGERFNLNLKYRCWHKWKHYVEKRLKIKEIKMLGDRIREERLRIRFFYLWMFRCNEKRSLQKVLEVADAKHNIKIMEKYFKTWKNFTKKELFKRKIEKIAMICYEDKLKQKFFSLWKNYCLQKNRYKYQMSVIHSFYENYLIKNYLNQWMVAFGEVKLRKKLEKQNLAVGFRNRTLLKWGLAAFQKNRERKNEKRGKIETFANVRVRVYMEVWVGKLREKVYWNELEKKAVTWREIYVVESFLLQIYDRYREKVEEREEMERVVKYSNDIILHKSFQRWYNVVHWKISKRLQLENAGNGYLERLRRKTFDKWRKFVLRKSRKKMAVEYYKLTLLSQFWNFWMVFLTDQKLKQAEAENLREKRGKNLTKKAFDAWKNEVCVSKSKLNTAINFCIKLKLSKAFTTWRTNVKLKTVKKIRYNRNKLTLNNTIIKNTILHWYAMHLEKEKMKKKILEFEGKHKKRLKKVIFGNWRGFVEKMKKLKENVKVYTQIKSSVIVEDYLLLLSEAVKRERINKEKVELAEKAEEKCLKRRYLRKWWSFVCWKREKVLRCGPEERKSNWKEAFVFVEGCTRSSRRRRPMIPEYLKSGFGEVESDENEHTFRVEVPVNEKLPIIDRKESYISFEL